MDTALNTPGVIYPIITKKKVSKCINMMFPLKTSLC